MWVPSGLEIGALCPRRFMRVHVVIEGAGDEARRTPEFAKPEVTLGRRPSNDIVIPDAGASGSHARVFVTGGALTIVDLDSTNGTFVNSERLAGPHVLAADDLIEIGGTKLRFSLTGVESTEIGELPPMSPPSNPSPRPSNGAATVLKPPQPTIEPTRDAGGSWPAPPPMMDELPSAAPPPADPNFPATDPRSAPPAAVFPKFERAAVPPPSPRPRPPSRPPSQPPSPPSGQSSGDSVNFEFGAASPAVLADRVFSSVWRRVSRFVLAADSGARERASAALRNALRAAEDDNPRQLGDIDGLHERMLAEMVDDGPIPGMLEGQPDEVVFVSAKRARITRRGHVSEGEGPFTCGAALHCWVRRVSGVALSPSTPRAEGAFGEYTVRSVLSGSGAVVVLRRRVARGEATGDGLLRAGMLSPGMFTLLSSCISARLNILVCAGPGARATELIAALMSGAPAHEMQVAIVNAGADIAAFPPSAVVLTRTGRRGEVLEAALGLGPDRLAVDEAEWSEAGTIAGVVSRTFSQVVSLRASTAAAGVAQLRAMLAESMHPTTALPLVMGSVNLIVTLQRFSDGADRVTQVAEPTVDDGGRLTATDIFTLVPGSRQWQFSGVRPRCFDDIVHRGFPLDPSIFA